jgi:tRNA-2-methylthio-N6-dimethylallyladenosine synthase
MTDDVLHAMAKYPNICKYIHLPVQSGNTEVLHRMNRGYSREWYMNRIDAIRRIMPDCAISTDIIAGFCGETDAEHADTVSLMKDVAYEFAYMFKYSERPKTLAERKFTDDVDEDVKQSRLEEIITVQNANSLKRNEDTVGKVFEVLVEGVSKKSPDHLFGRTSQNAVVVFPKGDIETGTYIQTRIIDCTSATLMGEVVA